MSVDGDHVLEDLRDRFDEVLSALESVAGCSRSREADMLASSRALWNRTHLVLESDEVLAQLLERGSLEDWRALYGLAKADPVIRRRIVATVARVPLPTPHFWLSALAALGERIDHDAPLPRYEDTEI